MPVQQRCQCGKQLTVPAELVGRQVRCPSCHAVMLVEPPVAVASARPAVEPDAIRFQCAGCGKTMKARPEHAGTQIVCPGCNATLTVPGGTVAVRPLARPLDEEPRGRSLFWVGMVVLLLVLGGGGFAAWWFFLRNATPDDLRLVPADASAFVSVRVAEVWKSDDVKKVLDMMPPEMKKGITEQEDKFGLSLGDCERVTGVIGDYGDFNKNPNVWAIFLTSKDCDEKKLLDQIMPDRSEETEGKHKYYSTKKGPDSWAMYFHSKRVFVLGSQRGVKACLDQIDKPAKDGPLKEAIKEAGGKRHFVAAGSLPSMVTAMAKQKLPPEMKPFAALLDTEVVMLASDLFGSVQQSEITLTFADSDKAGKGKDAAEALKKFAIAKLPELKAQMGFNVVPPEARGLVDAIETTLKEAKVEQKKDRVVLSFKFQGDMTDLMRPSLQKVFEAAGRTQGLNNLRQIGIALFNYENAMGRLPPPMSYDAKGQPLLSWRVHLLPYLEQEKLYNEFHLNEPWNSPHNLMLLNRMPPMYRIPGQPPNATTTHYQVFVGDFQAPFLRMFAPNSPPHNAQVRRLTEIVDGTSNTIAVAEAAGAVPWTKPEDVPFAPSPQGFSAAKLGLPGAATFNVVLFDGQVRSFPKSISPMNLQAWITPNLGDINNEP
jgi:hypothetical protein